jgi:hypothetical protein
MLQLCALALVPAGWLPAGSRVAAAGLGKTFSPEFIAVDTRDKKGTNNPMFLLNL